MSATTIPVEEKRERLGISAVEGLLKLSAIALQVVLVALIFRAVQLDSVAFRQVLFIVAITFPIHHLLPQRLRLPFFVLVSAGTIAMVIGQVNAAWLIGTGIVFIGLCHVPAPVGVRIGLLTLAALVLAAARTGWLSSPLPDSIWPILGAMFMFRLIVYLYDLAHKSAPFGVWRTLAYFFMIPNVCFPLFPVVDYQTFCRTYYNEDAFKTYQTGIKWMLRGAIHLIVYRVVYMFAIVSPAEVEGASGFFQYMVATYLLYLQVSGQFHTIVGLLHLYGFNLPQTNHHYLLASSFTDFWRRINIYWKDFMMKVFFYPLFFRLRKGGTTQAMILATLITFVATWFLHAYQWFWLKGAFLFTAPDVLFWTVLGILVTFSVWNESRSKKKVVPKSSAGSARLAGTIAVKTIATFVTITFLWSLWSSESVMEWWSVLTQLRYWDAGAVLRILLVLGLLGVTAIVVRRDEWILDAGNKNRTDKEKPYSFWRRATLDAVTALFIVSMSLSQVQSYMNPKLASLVASIERPGLNARDAAVLQRGYYEDLIRVDRFVSELQAMYDKRPKDYFKEWREVMNSERDDYIGKELVPSMTITAYGATYTTNEWGMRDKPYAIDKPAGVLRIGIVGHSHTMGWGVGDADVCDVIAEEALNAEGLPCELLNFSVNGYESIQKQLVLESKMLDFDLDAAFTICSRYEREWIVAHLSQHVKSGKAIEEPFIREIVSKANITDDMDIPALTSQFNKFGAELLGWSLKRFAEVCRERGVTSVWVYVPEIRRTTFADRDVKEIFSLAEQAGFDLILDLSQVYDGYSHVDLTVSEYDDHANPVAQRLVANCFRDFIRENYAMFAGDSPVQGYAVDSSVAKNDR